MPTPLTRLRHKGVTLSEITSLIKAWTQKKLYNKELPS